MPFLYMKKIRKKHLRIHKIMQHQIIVPKILYMLYKDKTYTTVCYDGNDPHYNIVHMG